MSSLVAITLRRRIEQQLLLTVALCAVLCCAASGKGNGTCIVLSFDGFRYDYADRLPEGTFQKLTRNGCRTTIIPVNPTKTFPNHWSLATGLYPEHHGIIDNVFYDRALRDTFTVARTESVWWRGEPVWVTAEKASCRAFVYFWPGSSTDFSGYRPTKWFEYNNNRLYQERIDSIVVWTSMPEPPALIMSYFELVDDVGHRYGPHSPQLDTVLTEVNSLVERLVKGLQESGVWEQTTLIIVSDHGMEEVPAPSQVQPHLTRDDVDPDASAVVLASNPNLLVYSLTTEQARDRANTINEKQHETYASAIASADLDPTWKIAYSDRIPDLIVMAGVGRDLDLGKRPLKSYTSGNHGFHNSNPAMHGIFVATGPRILPGKLEPLHAVDIYNIVCAIVGIHPARNDGNANRVQHIFR